MAHQTDAQRSVDAAGLCRRNALHVVRLAWTTHPHVGFDGQGVRWLDRYIDESRLHLPVELGDEFAQFMGCFYGECLIATFGGVWSYRGDRLGIHTEPYGHTFPFTAIERQLAHGAVESVGRAYFTAVDHLTAAAA